MLDIPSKLSLFKSFWLIIFCSYTDLDNSLICLLFFIYNSLKANNISKLGGSGCMAALDALHYLERSTQNT